ncbi:MAG: inorganic pyrophosphatase [Eisenbergiella sp.]
MLGDIVTVTVDRPLGSFHPEYKNLYYPVNYGYVKGIAAPDGEEQDAYIIGVNKPVQEFTGKLIAVFTAGMMECRQVAPEGLVFIKRDRRAD